MSYFPSIPWQYRQSSEQAMLTMAACEWPPLDHIPRIPEAIDTSMAAFWYRNGHKDDLMHREIWGGFRGVSK